MAFLRKLFSLMVLLALLGAAIVFYWSQQPITPPQQAPIEFAITPGSSVRSAIEQMNAAGVPVNATLLELLARVTGKSAKLKAGSYALKPGTTPQKLLQQLVRGEFAQEALVIIEGWTFKQMRAAINAHPALKHDTASWSDRELMAKISTEYTMPEGLFFPDTYLFARGASELQIYRQAYEMQAKHLNEAWQARDPALPYKTPYEALIMASIVEKETGHHAERTLVAGVFVNRLRIGMLLQTDPTVIYGMGERYQGDIRKRDLLRDTPYNTYTRAGLPPTPIALPGKAALAAALNPAKTDALYFVARRDGTSQFSDNLTEHNRAVNKYQR